MLMILFIIIGAIGGVYLSLYAITALDRTLGKMSIILLPLGFFVGVFFPWWIFRKFIHAKCPVDGETMVIERVTLPKRYAEEITRTGTRYHCKKCGTIK